MANWKKSALFPLKNKFWANLTHLIRDWYNKIWQLSTMMIWRTLSMSKWKILSYWVGKMLTNSLYIKKWRFNLRQSLHWEVSILPLFISIMHSHAILSIHTTPGHMYKAVLESILRETNSRLTNSKLPSRIHLML